MHDWLVMACGLGILNTLAILCICVALGNLEDKINNIRR